MISEPDNNMMETLPLFLDTLDDKVRERDPYAEVGWGHYNGATIVQVKQGCGRIQHWRLIMELTEDGMQPTFVEVFL